MTGLEYAALTLIILLGGAGGGIVARYRRRAIAAERAADDGRHALDTATRALKKSEAAAAAIEQRFSDFICQSADHYWESDARHRFTSIMPHDRANTLLPKSDWYMKPRWEVVGFEADAEELSRHREDMDAHRAFRDFAFSVRDRSGKIHHLRTNGQPLFDEAGDFIGYRGTTRMVTRQIEAERALAESEHRYRNLYHATPAMMHSVDRDGIFVGVSDFWLEALGYERDEVIGHSVFDYLTPQSQVYAREVNFPRFFERGWCRDVPYQFVKKDGRLMDVLLSAVAESDADGNHVRSIAVMTDVTERNRVEAGAKLAWERLVDAVESIDDAFCLYDADDRLVLCNAKYRSFFPGFENDFVTGVRFDELVRKFVDADWLDLKEPEKEAFIQRRIQTHRDCEKDVVRHLADGRWIRMNEYRTKHGETVGVRSDITDIKRREAEAREREERFHDFAAATTDRFWETDAKGRFTFVSPPVGRLNLPNEELLGRLIWPLDSKKVREGWEGIQATIDDHQPFRDYRYSWTNAEGQKVHIKMSGTPFFDENKNFKGYRGGVTDETSEIEALERVEGVQNQFLDAIESLTAGFVLWDKDDRFVTCNSRFRDSAPDNVAATLVPGVPYVDYLRARVAAAWSGDAAKGGEAWVKQILANRHQPVREMFSNGLWVQVRRHRLDNGGTLEFHTDITEVKEHERDLELARMDAEDASHAKSEFLSAMSHELRTPMNAILGFGQLLESNKAATAEVRNRYVGQILKGGRHLLELINQVLDLAKIEAGSVELKPEHVGADEVVDECLAMVSERAEQNDIAIVNGIVNANLPRMYADRVRFRQILLNLLSNAVKYNRPGGAVTISGRAINNDMIRLEIADTGHGIPEEDQDSLFQPFSRLGREGGDVEGTGIGLSITKQLVQLLGGRIGFDSKEGRGSTFWFTLPLRSQPVLHKPEQIKETPEPVVVRANQNGATNVLYVEDNRSNVAVMSEIVNQLPNTSMIAVDNANAALDAARENPPDLILMDINLPGMDGFEALKRLKAEKATRDIPVVAVSAAAMPVDVAKGLDAGFQRYLTKPVEIEEVHDVISGLCTDRPQTKARRRRERAEPIEARAEAGR